MENEPTSARITPDAMADDFTKWLKGTGLLDKGLSEEHAKNLAEAFMAGVIWGIRHGQGTQGHHG